MNCPNCGAAVPPGSLSCRKCGGSVEAEAPARAATTGAPGPVQVVVNLGGSGPVVAAPAGPLKSKLAAGLLGIFLGAFGVHRFYLGYNALGTVMLLITLVTCFWGAIVTGIWGVVEGILILVGVLDHDAFGRPLQG